MAVSGQARLYCRQLFGALFVMLISGAQASCLYHRIRFGLPERVIVMKRIGQAFLGALLAAAVVAPTIADDSTALLVASRGDVYAEANEARRAGPW